LPAKEPKGRKLFHMLRLSSVGLELGIAVTLGYLAGSWLDARLGTTPWLMIVLLIFGVAAGFRGVYTAARKAVAASNDTDEGQTS
jgi:F0F1-type ATP synthase assembly protein I